jgi:hypothetical protein
VLMLAPVLPSTIADMPPRSAVRPVIVRRAPEDSLIKFMREHDFAKPYNVPEIRQAATQASIPPSLIVCIEYLESSGGKYFSADTNNPLGWNNGQTNFSSKTAAIRHVSSQLGSGRWYAGKSLEEKLRMYNPRPVYSQKVMACMSQFPQ